MSRVFGTPRRPAYVIPRTDRYGRPISLDQRTAERHTVLITGPKGMGKSIELDRAEAMTKQRGFVGIRVHGAPNEPIENRISRSIRSNFRTYWKNFGLLNAWRIRRTAKNLGKPPENRQNGAEIRVGPMPGVQGVAKTQWGAGGNHVGKTLPELASQLAAYAATRKEPPAVIFMVDNVEAAGDANLATLVELSVHLHELQQPVFLFQAGGEKAASKLMDASRGAGPTATAVIEEMDKREVGPLTDAEARPALTQPLDAAKIAYQSAAIDQLVRAANGDPVRLRWLAEAALPTALQTGEMTVDVAKAATAQVNQGSRIIYEAGWDNCSKSQRDLLAKVAAHGQHGMAMPAMPVTEGPARDRWLDLDEDRGMLVAKGLLRDSDGRLSVSEPGLQAWVGARTGQAAAHLGVAPPTAQPQAPAVESTRAATDHNTPSRDARRITFTRG